MLLTQIITFRPVLQSSFSHHHPVPIISSFLGGLLTRRTVCHPTATAFHHAAPLFQKFLPFRVVPRITCAICRDIPLTSNFHPPCINYFSTTTSKLPFGLAIFYLIYSILTHSFYRGTARAPIVVPLPIHLCDFASITT